MIASNRGNKGETSMETSIIIGVIIALVAIVVVGLLSWTYLKKQRSQNLKSRFGPEYDRVVRANGNPARAEQMLEQRQKRLEGLDIKPLSDAERRRFADEWEHEQARFVDEPGTAVKNADRLVMEVMRVRGYPMGDFEQRAADVSVDHPIVVENYRVAHNIALRDRDKGVSTEELREAMIHYRALFADLLHDGGMAPVREVRAETRARAKEAGR